VGSTRVLGGEFARQNRKGEPDMRSPALIALARTVARGPIAALAVAGWITVSAASNAAEAEHQMSAPDEIATIADAAYVYGLPYIEMARTRQVLLDRAPGAADGFIHRRTLTAAQNRAVTTPNNDTLYSVSWLDLARGPVLLTTPDFGTRYWSVALMGMNTDNFAVLGTRTHGNAPGRFLIVAPAYLGDTSAATQLVRSPSRWIWVLARILVDGPADLAAVARLQDGMILTSLTPRGAAAALPAPLKPDDPTDFLRLLAEILAENPPPPGDAPVLARLANIGLVPGRPFPSEGLSVATRDALTLGMANARKRIRGGGLRGSTTVNGWSFPPPAIGDFGTDYELRAIVALAGLGALPPAEAVYASPVTTGAPPTGTGHWRMHFAADALPPVDAFWSMTLYEITSEGGRYFFDNPDERYAIGDRTPGLARNPDGSLDILIQSQRPETLASNWLPAPAGEFSLTFRAFLPRRPLLDGAWYPPPLELR
jgi:hypothetical protein